SFGRKMVSDTLFRKLVPGTHSRGRPENNGEESFMALINRMARLLTADLHAVLDRIEEPEALLRQAIREMEDAVADGERRIKALEAERDELAARRAKVEASLRDLDG